MKKILYIFIAFFTLLACDNREFFDDEDIQTAFPFEFNVESTEAFYLKSISDINLSITNSHEIDNQDYSISYKIVGGDSEVFVSGELVNGNFTMKKGSLKVGFKGMKTGVYTLVFTASNGKSKYDITKEIQLSVINKPFDPSVKADAEVFRTETNELLINVKVKDPNWVTYSWSWNSTQDNELKKLDGSIISKNNSFSIDPNKEYQFIFNPRENAGSHILFFTFKDTQGQEVTIDLKIDVKDINFDLNLIPINKEIFFDEIASLSLDFKPEFISTINPNTYKLTYYVEGAIGTLEIDGKILTNGESLDINEFPFEKKILKFKPTKWATSSDIKFVVEDKYGYKKEISTTLIIKRKEFTFSASKQSNDKLIIGEKNGFVELVLNTDANTTSMGYKMVVNSSDIGKVKYNGVVYSFNDEIPIQKGRTILEYIPSEYGTGQHNLSFVVSDITGQNKNASVSFEIYKMPIIKTLAVKRYTRKYSCDMLGDCKFSYTYKVDYSVDVDNTTQLKQVVFKGISIQTGQMLTKTLSLIGKPNPAQDIEIFMTDGGKPRPDWNKNTDVEVTFEDEKGYKTTMIVKVQEV